MRYVAEREKMEPEAIREEVARGRLIIPANVNHASLAPMCIGKAARVIDKRQHRQLADHLGNRGRDREAPHIRQVGRRYRDEPFLRRGHPEDTPGDHRAGLREILDIPHHVIPAAYLCAGYPENGFPDEPLLQTDGWRQRLSLGSLVSYERWGQRAL